MRIFTAGASGVIGTRLVPLLVREGHTVAGMTRSPDPPRIQVDDAALQTLPSLAAPRGVTLVVDDRDQGRIPGPDHGQYAGL